MNEKQFLWKTSSGVLALLLVLPILAIFYTAVGESDALFAHLMTTVMPTYIWNTLLLTFGVMLCSFLLGLPAAWLMAMCRLPSEKYLQWALVLPLAMPGYLIGYIYTDWFDFAGPVQIFLREITGWAAGDYWFPNIRTVAGAVMVLSLVLYPYVYLLCRAAFMEQSVSLLQSARLLKCSPWESFRRISLPLARPSIAVGLALVAMETIGDFGTVSYFAVNTLTTAVYDTWLGYSNLNAAAKISALMLFIIVLLLSGERYSRRKQKLFQTQFNSHEDCRYALTGWKKWLGLIWCWGLVLVAFVLPLLQLFHYALIYFSVSWTAEFRQFAFNSFTVAIFAAITAVMVALVMNFNVRLHTNKCSLIYMRIAALGYAVPGTVLAIGIMMPVLMIDHGVNDVAKWLNWGRPGLIFSGSMFAIIFAMVVRFSAVAIGSIETSLNKVSPSLDMAARTMGCNANRMLWRVHFPLVKRGILIAGLLVFIESMKELNAALLLRPFNFETLATYVYNYASDERLEIAAMPAILLVLVGLIPLLIVNRSLEQKH
ncbi:ABC transporter permease subunit [Vibrio sp. V27_P1S3P104]|uniref:ABC transporter permease n=1 Tax=unclassified Vibrio TaxID=2614977 RepID=UPI001372CEDA|nr:MULTISPECIES: iron ABC transporter permease [unclassified Vibrio]NAW68985.1 ABC transporter permease subunit [Vibrio sp. V28_P6S34P95]NAX04240.1 ABC transporter permease subunit [Vibrio sp. V30_P3S12P165]NAX34420.1 ABC transporter permease subunit [Vibrio sp. V29_P1S30P107]NAX38837.1 ABC transporter permease subunit [Vibrio sp. V27_P1S3P104]NAX39355.1 ABC transporter permease subunit [Vibrio sp. V26_P1S5P106]